MNRKQRKNNKPKPKDNKMANMGVRTPGTIITALARGKGHDSVGHDNYLMCRTRMLTASRVPSLPDGNNGRHVCVCLYKSDRISFSSTGTKSFYMQINGWLPAPIAIAPMDNTLVLNGAPTYAGGAQTFYPAGYAPEFAPSMLLTEPGALSVDPYNGVSARITAVTVSIMYTGPVTTAAGLIRATPNTINVNGEVETTNTTSTATPPTSGYAVAELQDGAIVAWVPIHTPTLQYEGNMGGTVATTMPDPRPSTVSMRPEQGMVVRLKHRTNDFKLQPLSDLNKAVTLRGGTTTSTGSASLNNGYFYKFGSYGGGIRYYDNDWEGYTVAFDGINGDASYVVDTCVCVEIIPANSSPYYQIAKESTKPNVQVIQQAQDVINNAPVVPLAHYSGPR